MCYESVFLNIVLNTETLISHVRKLVVKMYVVYKFSYSSYMIIFVQGFVMNE